MKVGSFALVAIISASVWCISCAGEGQPVGVGIQPPTQEEQARATSRKSPSGAEQTRRPARVQQPERATSAADEASGVQRERLPDAQGNVERKRTNLQPTRPDVQPGRTSRDSETIREETNEREQVGVSMPLKRNAVVRQRPGYGWPGVEVLPRGEEVVLVARTTEWALATFGERGHGWIPRSALHIVLWDEWNSIPIAPPPTLIAAWQGIGYGVLGQSADGSRLALRELKQDAPQAVTYAPSDKSILLARNMRQSDLPIYVGQETVAFKADEINTLSGRVLPHADEWMWLPWNFLLGHNDTYVWEWRPETDELSFARRPIGDAFFSPDGRHLLVFRCSLREYGECVEYSDAVLVPLDGSEQISLMSTAPEDWLASGLSIRSAKQVRVGLEWLSDSRAVLIGVWLWKATPDVVAAVMLGVDGQVTLYQVPVELQVDGMACRANPTFSYLRHRWYIGSNDTVSNLVRCGEEAGEWLELQYDLEGQFERAVPYDTTFGRPDEAIILKQLGRGLADWNKEISWSPDGSAAIAAVSFAGIWVYDAHPQTIRKISVVDNTGIGVTPKGVMEVLWSDDAVAAAFNWQRAKSPLTYAALINIDSHRAIEFDVAEIDLRPCGNTRIGTAHPDGSQFTMSTLGAVDGGPLYFWIDGLAALNGQTSQVVVIDFRDGLEASVRAGWSPTGRAAPSHRGGWSPNGKWFAIGGEHRIERCDYGE